MKPLSELGKIADEKLNTFEVNLSELLSAVRRDMREDDGKSVKDLSDEMLVFFRGLERADSSQKYIRIYSERIETTMRMYWGLRDLKCGSLVSRMMSDSLICLAFLEIIVRQKGFLFLI